MAAPPLRILQLTDLHLPARAGGRVWGRDVERNLDLALAAATACEPFHRLVLSGDLANSGASAAYERLARRLAPFGDRVRLLPGNHDRRERLRAAFPRQWPGADTWLSFTDELPGLTLVGLDSTVPRRTRGELGAPQLHWLRERLAAMVGPWLLFLHHPPVRVGTWWLDKDLVRDSALLGEVLAAKPPLAIVTGHVHQEFVGALAGTPVWTTPAVAYQYAPRSWLPLPRARVPALRMLDVVGDVVHTRIVRP